MFSINNLSVQYNGEYLFRDISYNINKQDRIGLVGRNGAGKTTMLRIMCGMVAPERGRFTTPTGTTIGYLPQEKNLSSNRTVLDETLTAFVEAYTLEKSIKKLTLELSNRQDYESDSYKGIVEKLAEANDRYDLIGGATQNARAERVLTGLGFDNKDLQRSLSEFSGGWQMRVELAKILLQYPDLLLLDEPTNHLDIESIRWLELFLSDYRGAVILVSHDRALLDNITVRTIEISNSRIYDYKACYTDYEFMRQERIRQESALFNNQQKQVEQIEKFINRFRAKATKARQVQSKIKLLQKMEIIEVDSLDNSRIHFRFNQSPGSGSVVVEANSIRKAYGHRQIIKGVDFMITRGERIAFVGRNGEGKTTLSKIIAGMVDYEGSLKLGHNVKIGYFAQNQAETLDIEKTVYQTLDEVAVGEVRTRIRGILGGFLFQGDDQEKSVKVLSGGEKTRLAIAKLLLMPVNFLILDEPTNHLDMRSKDILKNALLQFDGTVVVVSHDRDFLQGLTNKVFEFRGGEIKEFIGDIYDYIDRRNLDKLSELDLAITKGKPGTKPDKTDHKTSRLQKRDLDKQIRRYKTMIEKCEAEVEMLESKIRDIELQLCNPLDSCEDPNNAGLYRTYCDLKSQVAAQEKLWEELQVEVEKLEKTIV